MDPRSLIDLIRTETLKLTMKEENYLWQPREIGFNAYRNAPKEPSTC